MNFKSLLPVLIVQLFSSSFAFVYAAIAECHQCPHTCTHTCVPCRYIFSLSDNYLKSSLDFFYKQYFKYLLIMPSNG